MRFKYIYLIILLVFIVIPLYYIFAKKNNKNNKIINYCFLSILLISIPLVSTYTISYIKIISNYKFLYNGLKNINDENHFAFESDDFEKTQNMTNDEYTKYLDNYYAKLEKDFNKEEFIKFFDEIYKHKIYNFYFTGNQFNQKTGENKKFAYVTKNMNDLFNLNIKNGRNFEENDFSNIDIIPVIVGDNLKEFYKLNEIYDLNKMKVKIIGYTNKNQKVPALFGISVDLDDTILIPLSINYIKNYYETFIDFQINFDNIIIEATKDEIKQLNEFINLNDSFKLKKYVTLKEALNEFNKDFVLEAKINLTIMLIIDVFIIFFIGYIIKNIIKNKKYPK